MQLDMGNIPLFIKESNEMIFLLRLIIDVAV